LMALDIGYNRSSRRKSVVCCCNSFADEISPVAAYGAVIRPDVFRSVALMSAPFGGPPPLPFNIADAPAETVTPALTIPYGKFLQVA